MPDVLAGRPVSGSLILVLCSTLAAPGCVCDAPLAVEADAAPPATAPDPEPTAAPARSPGGEPFDLKGHRFELAAHENGWLFVYPVGAPTGAPRVPLTVTIPGPPNAPANAELGTPRPMRWHEEAGRYVLRIGSGRWMTHGLTVSGPIEGDRVDYEFDRVRLREAFEESK